MLIKPYAAPLFRNARRLISGPGTLADTAFKCETLCPSEEAELGPSFFLDGQIEKIKATSSVTTVQSQLDQALRSRVTHAPTLAYHIKDATLFGGAIYAGRLKHPIGSKRASSNGTVLDIETGAVCSSAAGTMYFGHWLSDDVLTYLLAERFGIPIGISPSYPSNHRPIYEKYFDQDWSGADIARIKHLIIFQDYSQTSLKKQRQLELRSRIEKRFPRSGPERLIYLKRNDTGVLRAIENEQEIIAELSRRGFIILDIKTDRLEKILAHFATAKMVVSVEGSHTVHGCYSLPAGSSMLLLQPANRFTATQRGWTGNIGVKFGFVVGDGQGDREHYQLKEILKTIDLML